MSRADSTDMMSSPPSLPSPALSAGQHLPAVPPPAVVGGVGGGNVDPHEQSVEANLGRKRCITFACKGVTPSTEENSNHNNSNNNNHNKKPAEESTKPSIKIAEPVIPPKRPSALTFACVARPPENAQALPSRPRAGSPAPGSRMGERGVSPSSATPTGPVMAVHKQQEEEDEEDEEEEEEEKEKQKGDENAPSTPVENPPVKDRAPHISGLGDYKLSDATRFHEFASSVEDEDWLNVSTDYEKKLTLNDCMYKENIIREIGEEVEDEVRQEEEDRQGRERDQDDDEDDDDEDEDVDNMEEDDDDEDEDDDEDDEEEDDEEEDENNQVEYDNELEAEDSDDDDVIDGNESDNESGFADSDDDSDAESDFSFWPRSSMTTTATSLDHHLDTPIAHKAISGASTSEESLLLSKGNEHDPHNHNHHHNSHHHHTLKHRTSHKRRTASLNLPDSTDFVCGTFDEDRPMEAAYISCMEERRRAKHIPIPQDIDPSFPTTEPEDDDDEVDEDGETAFGRREDPKLIKKRLEEYDLRSSRKSQKHKNSSDTTSLKSLGDQHSPRRLRSGLQSRSPRGRSPAPPPLKRHRSPRLRSPAPNAAIGHIFHRSPPPPPSSSSAAASNRRGAPTTTTTTTTTTPHASRITIIGSGHQRYTKTNTRSLPRTPNPFFVRAARSRGTGTRAAGSHRAAAGGDRSNSNGSNSRHGNDDGTRFTRGPIDIVAGLEKKKQKRREKFWRQHCRRAAKEQLLQQQQREKGRRPNNHTAYDGKGAELMRELGLEAAERFKAQYQLGQNQQLVLSI